VLGLIFTGETGAGFYDWHRLLGEIVLGLLLFRILWGLLGSSNARLSKLISNPISAFSHLRSFVKRDVAEERGHNPAGAWAALIMLVLLSVQALTGLFIADEDEFVEGAFYSQVDYGTAEFFYDIHHTNALFIKIAVSVHVVMVFAYLLYAKHNLISAMFTGRKRMSLSTESSTKLGSAGLGAGIAIVVFAAMAFVFGWI